MFTMPSFALLFGFRFSLSNSRLDKLMYMVFNNNVLPGRLMAGHIPLEDSIGGRGPNPPFVKI